MIRQHMVLEAQSEREQCLLQLSIDPVELAQDLVRQVTQVTNPMHNLKIDKFGLLLLDIIISRVLDVITGFEAVKFTCS